MLAIKWQKHIFLYNYAEDINLSCNDRRLKIIIEKLQEDADGIIQFMSHAFLLFNTII